GNVKRHSTSVARVWLPQTPAAAPRPGAEPSHFTFPASRLTPHASHPAPSAGVLLVPAGAVPGDEAPRLDVEEPALLVERRLQVRRARLAAVAHRHAPADFDPAPADVRLLDQPGRALADDAPPALLVDAQRDARVGGEVSRPCGP